MSGLLGSHILEAAAGLAAVYLILAMFCSTVNEWIASLLGARAANLRTALHGLLDNQDRFLDAFYRHPLITGLVKPGARPCCLCYLPARLFSHAVIDLVTPDAHGTLLFSDLRGGVLNLPQGDVRTALLALLQSTEGDVQRAQANIEAWFNDSMDRASVWYKRRAQWINVLLAAIVTVALNADTLTILRRLWSGQSSALLGWEGAPLTFVSWLGRVSGWCLTTAAVSLGAPFWFDMVNRFSPLRRR